MSTYTIRPLHDPESSTWTYILVDNDSKEAVIIDPVLEQVERDHTLLEEMGVSLTYILETHIHADHITGASRLKDLTGAKIGYGAANDIDGADIFLKDGEELTIGATTVKTIAAPGHTDGCTCYYVDGAVFTGDTLLIRACGRTDFQKGAAEKLYDSIHAKIFPLPDETLVYPGHNYKGMVYSTIGEEKQHNPRLKLGIDKAEFVAFMNERKLPPPKKIAIAVPANQKAGRTVA